MTSPYEQRVVTADVGPIVTREILGPTKPKLNPVWIEGPGVDPTAVRGSHPSGIGSSKTGWFVELVACGCGEWFARESRDGASDVCPRCTFASGLPSLDERTRVAMTALRLALDEHMRWQERDREREHYAFLELCHQALVTCPVLLGALESMYGRPA